MHPSGALALVAYPNRDGDGDVYGNGAVRALCGAMRLDSPKVLQQRLALSGRNLGGALEVCLLQPVETACLTLCFPWDARPDPIPASPWRDRQAKRTAAARRRPSRRLRLPSCSSMAAWRRSRVRGRRRRRWMLAEGMRTVLRNWPCHMVTVPTRWGHTSPTMQPATLPQQPALATPRTAR